MSDLLLRIDDSNARLKHLPNGTMVTPTGETVKLLLSVNTTSRHHSYLTCSFGGDGTESIPYPLSLTVAEEADDNRTQLLG